MEEFYLGGNTNNNKKKFKFSKLEIFAFSIIILFVILTIVKSFLPTANMNEAEKYYYKLSRLENKMAPEDATLILEYVEDYSNEYDTNNDSDYLSLNIKMYDDCSYLLVKKHYNDGKVYFENGNINVEKYNDLIDLMDEYSYPGLEKSEEVMNLSFMLPNKCLYRVKENMLIDENITEDNDAFYEVSQIISNDNTFIKNASKEVSYE